MRYILYIPALLLFFSCANDASKESADSSTQTSPKESSSENHIYEGEDHFKSLIKLTAGGENAEAYWSFDDSKLIFQRTDKKGGMNCDQIFYGPVNSLLEGKGDFIYSMVSTGKGKTTCSYYLPGNNSFVYASTHLKHDECPPEVDRNKHKAYVWPIHPEFEIFEADFSGKIIRQYTDNNFYDAEATVSPKGDKIVFTSNRSGDLELYTMNIDGSDVKQITDELGYDGGAFFSLDGSKIVWRASRPQSEEDIKKYKDYLAEDLVSPSDMEIFVANVDGSDTKQVTKLGSANWAPYFHPSGEKIIFCSNHHSGGFPFNLFMINIDGSGLEQITFDDAFDSFPMFSHNGKYLSFSSNRNNGGGRDTNIFIAEWKD